MSTLLHAFVHDFTTFAECIGGKIANKVGNYKKKKQSYFVTMVTMKIHRDYIFIAAKVRIITLWRETGKGIDSDWNPRM
jgi:hypothetical protein